LIVASPLRGNMQVLIERGGLTKEEIVEALKSKDDSRDRVPPATLRA